MTLATNITLNRFVPRPYQLPLLDAVENKQYRRVVAILPRRAGKDITCFTLAVRWALKRPTIVYYIFPTYSQGKKVLWDGVTNDGRRIIDYYLPNDLVDSKNSTEMKIRLKNGSLVQVVGSDNYDSLMGTNPSLCIFSEYALQDERAYQYIRPILTANDGTAVFISTPRGKNHLWQLYQVALNNDDWFAYKLTVEDTGHIPLWAIEKEKADGLMSEDLIQQEYYCSFELGVEGSYYQKYIDKMRVKGQISQVPYEPGFKVHTSWDLGMRDNTCIIFFQCIGQTVRIIDFYENNKEGLEHYASILQSKAQSLGYIYGKHFFPHDVAVRELGTGFSRIETLRRLGIQSTLAPNLPVPDGIEAVRASLSKIWIDEVNCAPLIKSLENYRQEYDAKRKIYKTQPLHNEHSHAADAMRYLCLSLPKTKDGLSPEELDKRYAQAIMGHNANMPAVFRTDLPEY